MDTIVRSQLQAGLYINRETFLDEKYILLSPEIPIAQDLIDRLERWKFDYLLTDGNIAETPTYGSGTATAATEDAPLAAIDQGRQDAKEMKAAQKKYEDLVHFAEQIFGNFHQNSILPLNPILTRVKTLVETIREERRYLLRIPDLDLPDAAYIIDHGVKTAIVAIVTGISLKLPPHRLIEIGTVALVHEIGMFRLPEQLYMSDRSLTDREREAISTHPVLGFKILRRQNFPMQLCLAVLECREHVDGSGYPRNLTNEKISNYAKILSPASAYAAMASRRPYRSPIDGHTIMKTILTGQSTRYDKEVLQAMVLTFSMFPYGTYVQLATGHRAVVVDIVTGKARSPVVRIITDGNGVPVREQPVLETNDEQYKITGVLSPEEIGKLKTAIR